MNILSPLHQQPVVLMSSLDPPHDIHWDSANKEVVWGWKRDAARQSRSVYFSGTLARTSVGVVIERYFFAYRVKIAPLSCNVR